MVQTEVEALQLEYSWIKEFDPRFNVKYRDDKSYPWLAVTLSEEYPRVMVGRGPEAQGHPLLRAVLPRLGDPGDRRPAAAGVPDALLPARGVQEPPAARAGPACSATSASAPRRASAGSTPEEHREIVDDFCQFMAGQAAPMIKRLEREMQQASAELEFERAARLRDDLGALQRAMEQNADRASPTAPTPT